MVQHRHFRRFGGAVIAHGNDNHTVPENDDAEFAPFFAGIPVTNNEGCSGSALISVAEEHASELEAHLPQIRELGRCFSTAECQMAEWYRLCSKEDALGLTRTGDVVRSVMDNILLKMQGQSRKCKADDIQGESIAKCVLDDWQTGLDRSMDEFKRAVLSSSTGWNRKTRIRVLKQHWLLVRLRSVIALFSPAVNKAVKRLVEEAYDDIRSAELTQEDRDQLFLGVRCILTSDTVPPSVLLEDTSFDDYNTYHRSLRANIIKGYWKDQVVAVKQYHRFEGNGSPINARLKRFLYQAALWRMLSHPNLLPFYGIVSRIDRPRAGRTLEFVTLWVEKGGLLDHLRQHPETDRLMIIRETASALEYLHRMEIIHGALRADNILMSTSGHALLTDYGQSGPSLQPDEDPYRYPRCNSIIWWMPPEIVKVQPQTKASDIYSFSSTILQIFTERRPFYKRKNFFQLIGQLSRGEFKPERPVEEVVRLRGLTDPVWELMMNMWAAEPRDRPEVGEVLNRLREMSEREV